MRKDLFQTSRKPVAPVPFPRDEHVVWLVAGAKAPYTKARQKAFSRPGFEPVYIPALFRDVTDEQLAYTFPGAGIKRAMLTEAAFREAVGQALSLEIKPKSYYLIRWNPEDGMFLIAELEKTCNFLLRRKVARYAAALPAGMESVSTAKVSNVAIDWEPEFQSVSSGVEFSIKRMPSSYGGSDDVSFSVTSRGAEPPKLTPNEVNTLAEEVEGKIERLLLNGFSVQIIESWLQKAIKPSRIVITKNYRIFLVDYDKEVDLKQLPKTLFFFYLKHDKGCPKKQLINHREEILSIYRKLTNQTGPAVERSIDALVAPLGNSYSEKSNAVKAAFLKLIPDRLAEMYYIHGPQGGVKGIDLDRSLVTWEVEL